MLKQWSFFYTFYYFQALYFDETTLLCNLVGIMQHDNFRNLNRMLFSQWKHLELRVNVFWYCFKVINCDAILYLMKSTSIPGIQNSFEIFELIWYMALLKLSDIVF